MVLEDEYIAGVEIGRTSLWESPPGALSLCPGYVIRRLPRRLTQAELEHAQDRILETSKKKMKREGEVLPSVHLFGWLEAVAQGGEIILPTAGFMRDDRSKDLLADIMPQLARGMGAYGLIHVCEAWSPKDGNEYQRRREAGEVIQVCDLLEVDRDEIVFASLETRALARMASYAVIRGLSGRPRAFRKREPHTGNFGGRFSHWLEHTEN